MEVVETCQEKNKFSNPTNQKNGLDNVKCSKKYVQPPRVKSFIPQVTYCPPKNPIDSRTTYHSSYYNENQIREARPQAIRPKHSINLPEDKFSNDTTNKLSFQPVWGVCKAKTIFPQQRLCPQGGPMESVTTIRRDYAPKFAPKLEAILPCGSIRTSKGALESTTTTYLSYINPGPVKPVTSFKPQIRYCRPNEPTANETTQKLSYLPYQVGKKENYPWAIKPTYRRPEVSMYGETTYANSYLENKAEKEKPIFPKDTGVFPCGAQFFENTVYRESFLPCQGDPVSPILPRKNLSLSDKRMASDTTNKLSFQPVKGEKRRPIMPRRRKILGNTESMQNVTTNQLEYVPKVARRPDAAIPCGHIRTGDQPLDGKTTTALSYVNPGPAIQMPNFKPDLKYCKPAVKIEVDTVNKLSYPQWSMGPREQWPWARRGQYLPPRDKIATDTVYHMSFPPPGHFVNDCSSDVGNNDDDDRRCAGADM